MADHINHFIVESSPNGSVGDPNSNEYGELLPPVTTLATLNVITDVTANFVVPSKGGNVTVAVTSSAGLTVGKRVLVETGGSYLVVSKPTGTSATLTFINEDLNVHTGRTVISGAKVILGEYHETTIPNPNLFYRVRGVTDEAYEIPYNVVMVAGAPQWPKHIGTADSEYGVAITTDSSGNVFVAGLFSGTINFGAGAMTSAGVYDLFIVKYSADGQCLWSKRYGGVNSESVKHIALDSSGNIFVGGAFYATCNFGGSDLTSAGDADPWLAKYDSYGNHDWSISFLKGTLTDGVSRIATDSAGNVYVTGQFRGSGLAINNGKSLSSEFNSTDAFLIKFNTSGVCQWAKNFFNYGAGEEGTSIAVDSSGNIVVGGFSQSGISLGGDYLPEGGYIGKFEPSAGNHLWSRPCGYNNPGRVLALTLDASDNVFASGYFSGKSSEFGGPGPITGTALSTDLFVAKYGSDGSYGWARALPGTNHGVSNCVAVNSSGDVVVTGYFRGTVNFGGVSYTSSLTADNGFVAKYDGATSAPVWAKHLAGAQYSVANGVAADGSGNVFMTGGFSGDMTFDGRAFYTAGGVDLIVARLT